MPVTSLRHRTRGAIAAGVCALAAIPEASPLRVAAAAAHEGAHAVAVVLSGGSVLEVTVTGGAGEVVSAGGAPAVILAVGYPAPLAIGAALCALGRGTAASLPGLALLMAGAVDLALDATGVGSPAGDAAQLHALTGLPAAAWWAAWAALGATAVGLAARAYVGGTSAASSAAASTR